MKSPDTLSKLSKNVFLFLILEPDQNSCRFVSGTDIYAKWCDERGALDDEQGPPLSHNPHLSVQILTLLAMEMRRTLINEVADDKIRRYQRQRRAPFH